MSTRRSLSTALAITAVLGAGMAVAEAPNLGKPISEADIKAWDITVLPDGTNLPPGSGTVAQGAKLYNEKGCVACHGEGGKGGPNVALASDAKLDRIEAPKTIANFWAQATTVFDFIRRAMPWTAPRTLSDDETYALTAYVLYLNKLIGENDVINAQTLPKVKMPNKDNFIIKFPDKI
jgi:S-disulfanyl-L-cysteine oxidoreductase SoxD